MANQELGLEITELTLGLPGATVEKKKRPFSDVISEEASSNGDQKRQKNKTQMVGWPPVCSYRKKNNCGVQEKAESGSAKRYVKVSKDGAAYLRKINLNSYKGYSDLALGFEELFGALNDSENMEFVPIYEDKDGDWMLVGDVPWEMFIESCKRLRMMKKTEDSV